MSLNEIDHLMIAHAAQRQQVYVERQTKVPEGEYPLVAWKPRRPNGSRRQTARIEINGNRRTVRLDTVRIPSAIGQEFAA